MELMTEQYRGGLGKRESFLISTLAREDKKIFTLEDVKAIIGNVAKRTIYNLVRKKCEIQGIDFSTASQMFPENIFDTLRPYWERELGRLLNPLPDLRNVLDDLQAELDFLP